MDGEIAFSVADRAAGQQPARATAGPGTSSPGPTRDADRPRREPLCREPLCREPLSREPLWRDVVGEVLRETRQARGRTLQDVATAALISMPYLSEIERGRKEASSEMLAAATRALGISMTELLMRVRARLVDYERAATARAARSARMGGVVGTGGLVGTGFVVAEPQDELEIVESGQAAEAEQVLHAAGLSQVAHVAQVAQVAQTGVAGSSRDALCLAA